MIEIFNRLLHIDTELGILIQNYGIWTYGILFLIIFLETGFVVTPFLPGDSLVFAAATFAASGFLNPWLLFILLSVAAILGDTINYWIGHRVGKKVFERDRPFISEEYLKRTQRFYEKHGKKTIILARFLPIIRTFAPFIAGVGKMNYREFLSYNIIGGVLWIGLFVLGGFFFGNIPAVRENFTLVILAIIIISFVPPIIEFWKHRKP
ncbi:MAG: DedA family protein [Candidatus Harrisonbacteria bacterium]|nr:DedA family protein [Candidatus Harrisonbacteria bacterium]